MALGQDIERLARIPLLGVMEPDALRLLAFSGETRIVLANTVIFERGQASEGGCLILSGSVVLEDQQVAPSRFGPGTLLGEIALLKETVHRFSAVAEETSTIFKLSRATVLRVLEEYPTSAQRMLAYLGRRLHASLTAEREPHP